MAITYLANGLSFSLKLGSPWVSAPSESSVPQSSWNCDAIPLSGAPSPPLTPPSPHQMKFTTVHHSIDSTLPAEVTYDNNDSFFLIYDNSSSTTLMLPH